MASLFSDEDFPAPAVRHLRRLGHDVLTCVDVGMANRRIPDDIVLDFASRLDRAVLTLNRDHFAELHRRGASHAGIIVCTAESDFVALAARIDAAIINLVGLAGRLVEVGS
jgi:predicted nuclease of predicted toxin-antitoxin system